MWTKYFLLILENSFWNVGTNYNELYGSIASATHENIELLGIAWVYTDATGWHDDDPTISLTGI